MALQNRTPPDAAGGSAPSIPLYCVNLPRSTDRKARMTRRFAELGLLDRVRFVSAIDRISPLVDQHLARAGIDWVPGRRRAEIGCLLSHLKALSVFLEETQAKSAIIFEDDVLLHRDWHEQLAGVLDNLDDGVPLCSLGYEVVSWDGFDWAGRDPRRQNVMSMNPVPLWGAHAYWITREHAQESVAQYDVRIGEPRLLSEFIVKVPGAFVAFPPLVIEDGMPSTIRTEHEMGVHRMIHHGWGVQNYRSDPEDHLLKKRLSDQTICLCMIVRNEAHVIGRLAASLEGLIDTWVICDTGSTDGTPEMVAQVFADLPGTLYHDEWKDFGSNRTLLLERARGKADYLLILDADQTIRVTRQLRSLGGDAYALLVDEPIAHWVPRLVRGDLPWRYVGAAHEYLTCDEPFRTENLFGLVVEHHADGGNRTDKMERELALLEADLAKDPNNPRTVFYLAQTHQEAGHDDEAIEMYKRRIRLGGWDEEVFYSMYSRAELVSRHDWDRGVALLLEAWAYRPARVEPLYTLVRGLRARNQFRLAEMFASARGVPAEMPDDVLFVHREPYEWGLIHEWSEAAYWSGNLEGALRGYDYLLSTRAVPPEILKHASETRQQCRVALGLEEIDDASKSLSREALLVPKLTALVTGASIGELQLSMGPSWSLSDPSIAADGPDFRLVLIASNGGEHGEQPENLYLEVEMDGEFAVRSVLAVDGVPAPTAVTVDGTSRPRLIALDGDWLVLAEAFDDDPFACRMVLSRLSGGEFIDAKRLTPPNGASQPAGWIPIVLDGQLTLITSIVPTTAGRWDSESASLSVVKSAAAPHELAEEWGATQAVRVAEGVLALTRRVQSDTKLTEHRFVLFGDDLDPLAVSPRFCFERPTGESCNGLALNGRELVLSFDLDAGGAYLARVPYDGVRAILWPL